MPTPQSTPPKPDEAEVSVFGPGFGESVVAHIGHGNWLIVDSCVEDDNAPPKPLQYLESIGVNPATAVRCVVASHWHDDHVAGLAQLLKHCDDAVLVCSTALTCKDFLDLAELYSTAPGRISPGPREIRNALEVAGMRSRRRKLQMLHHAIENRPIWRASDGSAQAIALSPSDEMVRRAHEYVARTYAIAKAGTAISDRLGSDRNDVATAIRLDVGRRSILLGSDLEASKNPLVGWSAVLRIEGATEVKSRIVKVPHHGALSGHQTEMWDELVTPAPFALLTPFRNGGIKLPKMDDRERILARTQNAFITAHPDKCRPRPPKRPPKVEPFINAATIERQLAYGPVGHVRWRAPIADPAHLGQIELFDGAVPLRDTLAA